MKRTGFLVICFCMSIAAPPAVTSEDSKTAVDSAGEAAAGKQTSGDTRASDGGTERTATGETATSSTERETEAGLTGTAEGAKRAAPGKTKRAGTATATGYIYEQVKKGNIEIQVVTDPGMVDDD
jgi:hypothetical protein